MTYRMIAHSIGPGMEPRSCRFQFSSISCIQSVPNHSISTYSMRCEARPSRAKYITEKITNCQSCMRFAKLTEEKEVGCRMTNEFNKRFLDETSFFSLWGYHIEHRVDWKLHGNLQRLNDLTNGGTSSKARQSLVPDCPQ